MMKIEILEQWDDYSFLAVLEDGSFIIVEQSPVNNVYFPCCWLDNRLGISEPEMEIKIG